MDGDTNLRIIKRSRHEPAEGEVFKMQIPCGKYLLGQVIIANPPREFAPMPVSKLIYIFSNKYNSVTDIDIDLKDDVLLIPPIWTNSLGWKRGVFRNIDTTRIRLFPTMKRHCFRDIRGFYVDEKGKKIRRISEPCGSWSLASYRRIDDKISDAIGIPRAPLLRDDLKPQRRPKVR